MRRIGPIEVAIAAVAALVALFGTIGADALWLPALGRAILSHGGIPKGVPFAAAPSASWPNVPVLAELTLHAIVAPSGNRGWLIAQLLAVTGGLAFLAGDMRRGGGSEVGSALALVVLVIGALPALVVIRVQLFSLLLMPALALLLRDEASRPSRRVWLVPVVLALWSNLHGAVLVGLALAGTYLLFSRARFDAVTAAAVLAVSALAVCATPALERTPAYYLGVLHNEAARQGTGLWAPLSLGSAVDLLLIGAALVLVALGLRARPSLWEAVALVGLALVTVKTARSGVWLLFFAAPLAAQGLRFRAPRRRWLALPAVAALLAVAGLGLVRGPHTIGADKPLLDEALRRAGDTPILADGVIAEQIDQAGGRVWMSNPLDAFSRDDQRLYVAWTNGKRAGLGALAHAPRVVVVNSGGKAAALAASASGLREVAADAHAVLYVERR